MPRIGSRFILVLLAAFAFVSYLLRINISVAAEPMMPALGLTKIQMGQIFTGFLVGYAVFQIPGGWLGDRIGPKRTLGISVLVWGVCTALTGIVSRDAVHASGRAFLWLWLIRFVLGLAEATTYPVGARVVYNWIAPPERAFANSLMLTGTSVGAAAASPIMSWLMLRIGWPESFVIVSIPAFLLAIVWLLLASDKPSEAPIASEGRIESSAAGELKQILRSRRILLLCVSYISEGFVLFIFVFWLYIYLVEVRGFGMLKGGLIAALPWMTGICFTPLGGFLTDRLSAGKSKLTGSKIVVTSGYSACGLLLFAAAYSPERTLCIAALCLSVGFLMAAEAPFWASATYLSGPHSGTVSGIMNTAGILGGIVSTSLVPVLVARFGWLTALGSGTVMAFFCSFVWLGINEDQQSQNERMSIPLRNSM